MSIHDRGFASMSMEKRRRISSLGGIAAHAKGVGHRFTSEEAREAGKKGGGSHSREHMSRIGKLGGRAKFISGNKLMRAYERSK